MPNLLSSLQTWVSNSFPDELSTAGFTIGVLTILISLRGRFDIIAGEDIPEELREFRLKELTSTKKYRIGLLTYFFFIILVYSFFVLTLSRINLSSISFIDFGNVNFGDNPDSLALYVALTLAGIIPNIPYIDKFELFFRQLAQRYSGIPADHNRIFEKIQLAEIDEDVVDREIGITLTKKEIEQAELLVGKDTLEELRKCKLVLSRLISTEKSTIEFGLVTVKVKELFDTVLDVIREKIAKSQNQLKEIVSTDQNNSGVPLVSTEREIRRWFKALSYILGCAIIADSKVKESNISEILKTFGFEPKDVVRSDIIENFQRALFYSFCAQIFLNIFVFYAIGILDFPRRLLPSGLVSSFALVAPPFLATVICTKVYIFVRERKIANGSWFSAEPKVNFGALLLAALLSFGSIICLPYLELIFRFAEADELSIWTFHSSPREYLSVFAQMFSYPISFVLTLMLFTESERRAAHDTKYHKKLYSRSKIAFRAFCVLGIFMTISLLFAEGSTRFIIENPNYLIPDDIRHGIEVDALVSDLRAVRPYYFVYIGLQSFIAASIFCVSFVTLTSDRK